MKTNGLLLQQIATVAAFWVLTITGACAQTIVKTRPAGFMPYTLAQNATASVGFPLTETPAFVGPVLSFTTNAIQAGGVAWTPGQFAVAGAPYFVAITSGQQVGRILPVTTNTTDTLTLDTGDTGLDASGFTLVTGATADTFELFAGYTLGTFFGTTAISGVLPSGIQGGTSAFTADGVQIYNGVKFVTFFFNTTVNAWTMVNGGTTDQTNTILPPGQGLLITRRGPTATLWLAGRVPSTSLLTKLPNASTTAVSVRFPTDTTLAGLAFSGPGTWIQSNSIFTADSVNLWNGIKWVPYFKNTGGVWNVLNGGTADQGATVIPAGTAVLIIKRGTTNSGPSTFFSEALPYSLN